MQEITNMLQRMRELAVQSANDTNSADDRLHFMQNIDQLDAGNQPELQTAPRLMVHLILEWNGSRL